MLRTTFSASFLTPDDLALLGRVLDRLQLPSDSAIDREVRAAALLQIFQTGISDEEELIKALARRNRS